MSHTELFPSGPEALQSGKLDAASVVLLRAARPPRRRVDFAIVRVEVSEQASARASNNNPW